MPVQGDVEMKKHHQYVLKSLKQEYDISIECGDDNRSLKITQKNFFRMLDLVMLSRHTDDYLCKEDVQDYRDNISTVHIDNILDEFLTITGGPDETYEKGYDLDRYNGTIVISNNVEDLLNWINRVFDTIHLHEEASNAQRC